MITEWLNKKLEFNFFGVLKDISFSENTKINSILVDRLLEMEIIQLDADFKEFHLNNPLWNESKYFRNYFIYNRKRYCFNKRIFFEIYQIIKSNIEYYSNIELENIKKSVDFDLKFDTSLDNKILYISELLSPLMAESLYTNNKFAQYYRPYKTIKDTKSFVINKLKFTTAPFVYLTEGEDHKSFYNNILNSDKKVWKLAQRWDESLTFKSKFDYYYSKIEELKGLASEGSFHFEDTRLLFKDLMHTNDKEYDELIDSLLEKNILQKRKDNTLVVKKQNGLSLKTFCCALGIDLIKKGYLPQDTGPTNLAKALNDTFGCTVNKQMVGGVIEKFETRHVKTLEYFKPLSFIKYHII